MTINVHVDYKGFSRIDFDKRRVRKAMQGEGKAVQKVARRMVARKAVSAAGAYPGRQSGELSRSIRYRVSKSGFLVRIAPVKTAGMKDFYPAFLFYGTSRGVDPRGNYMADALQGRADQSQKAVFDALHGSLIPRT